MSSKLFSMAHRVSCLIFVALTQTQRTHTEIRPMSACSTRCVLSHARPRWQMPFAPKILSRTCKHAPSLAMHECAHKGMTSFHATFNFVRRGIFRAFDARLQFFTLWGPSFHFDACFEKYPFLCCQEVCSFRSACSLGSKLLSSFVYSSLPFYILIYRCHSHADVEV